LKNFLRAVSPAQDSPESKERPDAARIKVKEAEIEQAAQWEALQELNQTEAQRAMAEGKPLLKVDILDRRPEMPGERGRLRMSGDVEALSSLMRGLAEDNALRVQLAGAQAALDEALKHPMNLTFVDAAMAKYASVASLLNGESQQKAMTLVATLDSWASLLKEDAQKTEGMRDRLRSQQVAAVERALRNAQNHPENSRLWAEAAEQYKKLVPFAEEADRPETIALAEELEQRAKEKGASDSLLETLKKAADNAERKKPKR
jgi:hypothetical protein